MRHIGGIGWLAVAVIAGCGGGPSAYPPAWVGTDDARRTAVTSEEAALESPPRETLLDEVTLAYADGQTACFDVILRARTSDDVALADLGARCRAGTGDAASEAPAEPSSVEMVSVYDYADNGDLVDTAAEEVPGDSYDPAGAEPAADGLHRVVERRARLCCPAPRTDRLTLVVGPEEIAWPMD